MALRIPTDQIRSLQQIEAAVAGPDGANRLITVIGQFDVPEFTPETTYTVLIGPVFKRAQFFRAICSASVAKTISRFDSNNDVFSWGITNCDADFDDDVGQVKVTVEVFSNSTHGLNLAHVLGVAFQVTILATIAA